MSLYTVTFDSTDSNDEPIPIPITPPSGKHVTKKRVRPRNQHRDETTVVTERVDLNSYGNTEETPKKHEIRRRHHRNMEEEPPADFDDEDIEQPKKRTVKRRRRGAAKEVDEEAEEEVKENIVKKKELRRKKVIEEDTEEEEEEAKESPKKKSKRIPDRQEEEEEAEESPKKKSKRVPEKQEEEEKKEEEENKEEKEEGKKEEEDTEDTSDEKLIKQLRLRTNEIRSNNLVTYVFSYTPQISWKGKRIHFQLSLGDKLLYHAKTKARSGIEEIPINKGSECHFSSEKHEAVILVGNQNLSFSLRLNTKYGDEVCNLRFYIPETKSKPRTCSLTMFGENLEVPKELITRPFTYRNGVYMIRVSSGIAKSSIKNCVLVDKKDNEWIIALKVDKGRLSIQASPKYDPLIPFMVGIASYMCV